MRALVVSLFVASSFVIACGGSSETGEESVVPSGSSASGSGGKKSGSGGKASGGASAGGATSGGAGTANGQGGTSGGGKAQAGGSSSGGSSMGQGGTFFGDSEICDDGLDNNGDGQVDEGCSCTAGVTEACYLGAPWELGGGKRCKSGSHTCIAAGEFGSWGPCEGAVLAEKEVCDGVDNDCDGVVDDGCDCVPGKSEACGNGKAPCKQGTKTCDPMGKWGPCEGEVTGTAEKCDGIDNDCDGIIDNGGDCECVPGAIEKCGTDVGECSPGAKICGPDAKFGPCQGGVPAEQEVCDGVDNDCDGLVDEESPMGPCQCVPGTQQECGLMAGECKPGVQVCQQGGSWSDCVGGVPPKTEVCNGKDDDCDGVIDKPECQCLDGEVKPCEGNAVGTCNPGTITCVDGKLSECKGVVGPTSEVCDDGLDNDCDGVVDNGCVTIVEVALNINGDCVCSPPCPPEAPFPVGCSVDFNGGDPRGCVATAGARIYFQEGDACGAGNVQGKLLCSNQQGNGLNAQNCPINKPDPTYGDKPSDCAKADGSKGPCYF